MKNEVFSKSLQYKNDLLAVHTRKVNFILVTINWVAVLIIILMSIVSGKPANNPIAMGVLILGTVLCTSLFYLKKHDMIQANIICYTMMILNFINNIKIKDMGPVDQCLGIAYFMIGIIYMTIYFNKKSFLIFAVSVEVLVATLMLLSENIAYIWKIVILIDVSMLILYFVTKWGGELIAAADTEGKEAMRLLNNQQKIAAGIEQNTSLLNLDIIECNTSLQSVTQVSDEFVKSVQEVAIGVSKQAGSLVDINGFINNADMVITETAEVSYKMSKVSDMARSVVLEGSENIIEMSKQIAVIGNTVSNSYQTVSELQKSMDEINAFLSVISGIAEQTNLLSLNASIEAARAGENGKGFAVVASEIRKLADQSVQSAGMINNIINGIKNKSMIALKEVEAGKAATKSGEEIVKMVNTSFVNIQDSFNDIDSFVELELKAIQKTTEIFKRVQMEITNITNISEEHSAAAEEMLSSNEEINSNIENIYNLMLQIHSSSETLEQMTKQNKMEE